MSIGNNIKLIRKEKKMTQQEFANHMEISRSYLSDIENNRKNPSSSTLEKISEKLDVSMVYLTTGNKILRDLTDREQKEIFSKYKEQKETFSKYKENIQKDIVNQKANVQNLLIKLSNADLTYSETFYLSTVLNFIISSDDKDLKFMTVLFNYLERYKDAEISDEDFSEVIDDLKESISDYLKGQYPSVRRTD
ncbi:helix-turn-helix transcriptional regulator [Macrococcus equipercicus]|uniref:Helix-turn-helix transcriptional regulator n=1 Tax=Macrococcus equipercicus TaxID=69967 RepID=A0ABQ6RB69_9STAP|nr:helix-turn-helix transcriptional regulator [Macrococcus equipercicus]KAA1042474.1 helix-turn-helix transcriptional regulator [Macrococcus equipercicus]